MDLIGKATVQGKELESTLLEGGFYGVSRCSICCLSIPSCCFSVILFNTLTDAKHKTDLELRPCVPLFGCRFKLLEICFICSQTCSRKTDQQSNGANQNCSRKSSREGHAISLAVVQRDGGILCFLCSSPCHQSRDWSRQKDEPDSEPPFQPSPCHTVMVVVIACQEGGTKCP
jgi:hypothetical protein